MGGCLHTLGTATRHCIATITRCNTGEQAHTEASVSCESQLEVTQHIGECILTALEGLYLCQGVGNGQC